jgi:hypothetical protein
VGFSFLAPLFLAGLAALAIPVLIHLTHRERRNAIRFPSLMFLRKVPYRTVRRQRIRHWLLFLLRAAAIALLVAAFARPLLDRVALGTTTLGSAREVVILVDRSYSMGYGDRWDRALDAARATVDGLGPEDRATIVFFADGAEAANLRSADRAALRALLDGADVGTGGTQFGPALQMAGDILERSDLPRREAVLITDFQRAGWNVGLDTRLPNGTVLTPIDLSDASPENVATTNVLLERVLESGRHRLAVAARIVAFGTAAEDLPVTLELDGVDVETRTVRLAADGSATVRFAPVTVPDRVTRGRVRIARDALPQDDVYHFTVAPVEALPTLIVQHTAAPASDLVYLRQALSIGRDPPFDVRVRRVSGIGPNDLEDVAMVILADAPYPRGAVGRQLVEFVHQGGGLLVVLGRRSNANAWTAEAATALGFTPGPVVDRLGGRGATFSVSDYNHPVFAPFSAPRSGDFSASRFFRYRRWEPAATVAVLARFDDGAVALGEMQIGQGRVLVWSSGLANLWNNLPVQPVFLPFLHEVVRFLAHYRPSPSWRTAGHVLDLSDDPVARPWGPSTPLVPDGGELIVESPSGERFAHESDGTQDALALSEQGFYLLRRLGDDGDGPRIVAVNADRAESDLTRLDPEEFVGAIAARDGESGGSPDFAAMLTAAEKERRQGLWWYLLIAVLFVLLAETTVAHRFSRARP